MSECNVRKFSLCRLIGLGGVMFIIVGVIFIGAGSAMFVNLPSLAIVFGITFFLLLATFGTDFLRFVPDALVTLVATRQEPNKKFAEIAAYASRYIIGAGVIGALIGLVQMLCDLSDPSSIGAGMATALIVPFYAIVASEIFFAYLRKAYSDGGETSETEEKEALSLKNIALPSVAVGFMLIGFFVLLISFSG